MNTVRYKQSCTKPKHEDLEYKKIIECGKLVESLRPPDTFYNGWYPVRRCSFSGHSEAPRFGKSNPKTTAFRDYRVICDFCDKKKPLPKQTEHPLKDGIRCINRVKKAGQGGVVDNTHWRFHDAHSWINKPTLQENDTMHHYNWFTEQINLDLRNKMLHSEEQRRERFMKLKRFRDQEYKEALREAQEKLKEQQKQCSFKNSIHSTPPPLPPPPRQPLSVHILMPPRSREGSAKRSVNQEVPPTPKETISQDLAEVSVAEQT